MGGGISRLHFVKVRNFFSATEELQRYFSGIKCKVPEDPVNGAVFSITEEPDEMGNIPYRTKVTYSCDAGYDLSGSKSSICEGGGSSATGVLNPPPPTCESEPSLNIL